MSRCFPYPPPGYTLSRATDEALIESIKLQEEKEKKEKREKRKEKKETKERKERKKERKERKKERKERKRERKEREKEKKDETNQNSDKSDITKDHVVQKSSSDAKLDIFHKNIETGTEQLERSNLTEEHAHPVSLSIPSTSSESTENSNKRKRHSSPRDDTCGHGKVILIRLPSKKQDEFDVLAKEEQPCSTSGRSACPPAKSRDVENTLKGGCNLKNNSEQQKCSSFGQIKAKDEEQPCSTSGRSACPPAKSRDVENTLKGGCNLKNNSEQQKCSSFGQIKGKNGIKSTPEALLTPMQKMDLRYKNLLENRFPPQIQDLCLYTDDLDWLLKGKNQDDQETRAEKKRRFASDSSLSCSRSVGSWLRAEYLREVDVYALPFTVPY